VVGSRPKRVFLFLQGLATPFFANLADELVGLGHSVERINLSGGDWVFWPRLGAVNYRGRFSDWRPFLGEFLHARDITDVIVFGDCRPYHRVALDLARSRGIDVHVFEEGYFRPEWITIERGGTNGHSALPRDPAAFLEEAAQLPPENPPTIVAGGIVRLVRWEILNQLSMMILAPLYPNYRRHRSHHPMAEMCGWVKRLLLRPFERRYAERLSRYLDDTRPKYYLLPLQLETDYQIRRHSPFKSMAHVMEVVMESFARSAPRDALLVVKLHPLDNGLANFRKQAKQIARRLHLARSRVLVMDGGHLPTLISRSGGVVVVNSTTGLSALNHKRPVAVLGNAIFNIPGLTFRGRLDDFWHSATPPDTDLFKAFRRVVLARAQVNGSFFTDAGMKLAVQGALAKMEVLPAMQAQPLSPSVAESGAAIVPAKSAVLVP
jgi:capsular polysaccharide export protein